MVGMPLFFDSDDHRVFVDALRCFLGLAPLYSPEVSFVPLEIPIADGCRAIGRVPSSDNLGGPLFHPSQREGATVDKCSRDRPTLREKRSPP